MQQLSAKGSLCLIGIFLLFSFSKHTPLAAASLNMDAACEKLSMFLKTTQEGFKGVLDTVAIPTDSIKGMPLKDSLAAKTSLPMISNISDTLPPAKFDIPRDAFQWFRNIPSSTVAILCAIIPGGGQLYNKQYWKIPVVLGIGTGCAYAINRFGGLYNEYHTAYRDFMSPDPLQYDSWKSFVPPGADPKDYIKNSNIQSRLKKGTDYYRRNRDLSIVVSALVYLLTIVDAYVDAELVDFDISPDLSLLQNPLGKNATEWQFPTAGLQCSIRF